MSVECGRLAKEELGLPLAGCHDEDRRSRGRERLVCGEDGTHRALACLPAATQYLAGMLLEQDLLLPGVGIQIYRPGKLYGVVGDLRQVCPTAHDLTHPPDVFN